MDELRPGQNNNLIISNQIKSIICTHFDNNLLNETNRLLVSPSWFVLTNVLHVSMDPDLGISAVHLNGQQGVAGPQNTNEGKYQHCQWLQKKPFIINLKVLTIKLSKVPEMNKTVHVCRTVEPPTEALGRGGCFCCDHQREV